MDDLISRQAAIDAFWKLEVELRPSAIDAVLDMLKSLPSADLSDYCDKLWKLAYERGKASAEKTQLSGEDATSVCKCPCEYREPCDYCHYDAYRGHGCPAEEGLKDE